MRRAILWTPAVILAGDWAAAPVQADIRLLQNEHSVEAHLAF